MKLLAIAKGITDRYVACSNLDNTPRASNFILGYCRGCYMQHIYLLPFAMVKNRPLYQYLWAGFSSLRYPWHQNDLPASGLQCASDLWCSDLGTTSHDLLPLTLSTYYNTSSIITKWSNSSANFQQYLTSSGDDPFFLWGSILVRRCKKLFGGDWDPARIKPGSSECRSDALTKEQVRWPPDSVQPTNLLCFLWACTVTV